MIDVCRALNGPVTARRGTDPVFTNPPTDSSAR